MEEEMKYHDLTLGQIEAIINKLGGMEGALSFLRGEKTLQAQQTSSTLFTVEIDYGLALSGMIADGKYDWVNGDLTERLFRLTGRGIVVRNLQLLQYDRTTSSEEVLKIIEAIGVEPAAIEDLLAFGAKYPDEQRKYPVIALGSSAEVRGDRYVPYLGRDGAKRRLSLSCSPRGWARPCRFLARNKVSAT